ncbi:MAG: 1-acyl-sn-glycerol-3-phosphate acyltransferase [Kofleriaceae bacterium]
MASDRPVREAENRLAAFNADRPRLLGEVERRVTGRLVERARAGGEHSLEYVLNDVAYSELRRLEHAGGDAAARWRELSRQRATMSDAAQREELRRLVSYYGHDIVGSFDPRVYAAITGVAPRLLGFWFSPVGSLRQGLEALGQLDSRIQVDGELDVVRACAARGTIVVTPTHSSNMDSPVIGLALARAGLPPVTYGAGKNLFSNPFISFFMRNLGAYRVDRRLRFALYKDVLKEYSTVLLEHGYHSLFFPGGTRCRSNVVERQLKLGLLGTTVTAYRNAVRERGGAAPRVYVVPATINYRLVLEAATLIEDYLAETGKNRYIITDDEFSRLGRIVDFVRKTLALEGSVIVRFGRPLDPFGNDVDDDGRSLDRAGRPVDPATYVRGADGEVVDDDQRDAEYTRILGGRLAAAYPRLTVLHATSLVARALFDAVAARVGTRDVYRLLRAPADQRSVAADVAVAGVERLRRRLAADPDLGAVHPQLEALTGEAIVDDALRGFATYHRRPIARRVGEQIQIDDLALLFYYQNRTAHVGAAEGA